MTRGLLLFLAGLCIASPAAAAWAPPPELLPKLLAGEVHAEVSADPESRAGVVRAAIDIAAPPSVVYRTILDCERAGRMTPSVKRCTVLSRDPSGRSDIREHLVKWSFLAPALHSVSRCDYEQDRLIRFRCIGGDIKFCEGEWRLEPLDGGKATRVIYENHAAAPYDMPASLATAAMRRDVPTALLALRRESLAAR